MSSCSKFCFICRFMPSSSPARGVIRGANSDCKLAFRKTGVSSCPYSALGEPYLTQVAGDLGDFPSYRLTLGLFGLLLRRYLLLLLTAVFGSCIFWAFLLIDVSSGCNAFAFSLGIKYSRLLISAYFFIESWNDSGAWQSSIIADWLVMIGEGRRFTTSGVYSMAREGLTRFSILEIKLLACRVVSLFGGSLGGLIAICIRRVLLSTYGSKLAN